MGLMDGGRPPGPKLVVLILTGAPRSCWHTCTSAVVTVGSSDHVATSCTCPPQPVRKCVQLGVPRQPSHLVENTDHKSSRISRSVPPTARRRRRSISSLLGRSSCKRSDTSTAASARSTATSQDLDAGGHEHAVGPSQPQALPAPQTLPKPGECSQGKLPASLSTHNLFERPSSAATSLQSSSSQLSDRTVSSRSLTQERTHWAVDPQIVGK
jgi:hypothetical protein